MGAVSDDFPLPLLMRRELETSSRGGRGQFSSSPFPLKMYLQEKSSEIWSRRNLRVETLLVTVDEGGPAHRSILEEEQQPAAHLSGDEQEGRSSGVRG